MKRKLIKSVLKGILVSASLCVLLAFALSFVLLRASDPSRAADLCALPVVCLSAFAGGLCAAKTNGEQGLVCGAAAGGMVCVLLFSASLLHGGETGGYFLLLPVFLSALLGGFLGRPSVKRKRRKKAA